MTPAVRPRRSVLYIPGSSARALEKAKNLAADAFILDLEDAVAPDAKEIARARVCEMVKSRAFGGREVAIRVNSPSTVWGESDLAAVAAAAPDAVVVPKVSHGQDLLRIDQRLSGVNARATLWAMIETPRAILNLGSIAGSTGRLACLVMGTNDLIKELRAVHVPDRRNLWAALGLSVSAARAFGLGIVDGVYNDIGDAEGFQESCRQARSFGFDGKTLIHPAQIEPCNEVFSPSLEEIEASRRIIAAFDRPENRGKGAIAMDGRMVERLHAETARQMLALAEAIASLKPA